MFHRVGGLFQRYVRQHRYIEARGFSLSERDQPTRGHIDGVVLSGGRVTFTGWSTAERIFLINGDTRTVIQPDIARQDVADVLGISPRVGFEISHPYGSGEFTLVTETGGVRVDRKVSPFSAWALGRNRLKLAVRFAWTLLRLAPQIAAAQFAHNPQARTKIKNALGLQAITEASQMDVALFAAPDPVVDPPAAVPITLIMPVYNAFDLLPEVLSRVVEYTDLPWHLIVVEDCSSDPAVRPWLQNWVTAQEADTPGRIELMENADNKGFIGSVNAGLTRAGEIGNHVVLLNSDALVPAGWASRLLRPILTQDEVASVTPMSNDAEIFTVPVISRPTPLLPGQGDVIDQWAQKLNPDVTAVVPTGVGFCMAMNIEYIRKAPQLDPSFGRGYGEEVDWCQKVRALGGRHLGLPSLFVEHRGGTSFGSAEKLKLVLKNNQIIAGRYPGYDAEVQEFITADSLITARMALAIAWAAAGTDGAIPIYLAHSLGGGADHYLERRIADDLATSGCPAIILRVGGTARWQVELVSDQGRLAGTIDDFTCVETLLDPVMQRRIVYSCGVGDRDPVSLPGHLLALKRNAADRIEVLVHDFFMVSPSYTLLNDDGLYHGPVTGPRDDKAHQAKSPEGGLVTAQDWMRAWGALMGAADEIVVFSADSRDQIKAAYPDHSAGLVLRPHHLLADVPAIPRPAGPKRVIGVLGNIGYQKGAAVVAGLGRMIHPAPDLGLVLVGNVDPAYMPPASVVVHGNYQIDDLTALVARYGITDWLIPSVWPETFSYTTHECLATGLPVYAFDIGAQGDAVKQATNGHAVAFSATGDLAQIMYDGLTENRL